MTLTNIFSVSTLICLGITLLIVGIVSMFFMQRLNEQNHKVVSMLGLISTMAEELNFIRSRVQMLSARESSNGGSLGPMVQNNTNSLISVSDEDDDSSEDGENTDSEEEDDSDSEEDDDSEEEEEEEEEECSICEFKQIIDEQNIKTINMGETLEMNINCEPLEELNDEKEDEINDSSSDLDNDSESSDDENDIDNINEIKEVIELNKLNDIDQNNDDVVMEDLTNETFNLTNIKSIDIFISDKPIDGDTLDYKKMSLNKLKSIVVEKKLATDASKLKKNELLKLLGSE